MKVDFNWQKVLASVVIYAVAILSLIAVLPNTGLSVRDEWFLVAAAIVYLIAGVRVWHPSFPEVLRDPRPWLVAVRETVRDLFRSVLAFSIAATLLPAAVSYTSGYWLLSAALIVAATEGLTTYVNALVDERESRD